MNDNQRIKVLSLLSDLDISATRDGKIKVSLHNCSVSNIDLCQEFARAREASPRVHAPHPHYKNTWVRVEDDLDKDPRYLNRNVVCSQEAKDFATAVRLLYNLATDPRNIVVRSHEEDAGWGNSSATVYAAYQFDGQTWKGLPEKELHRIRSLSFV